MPFFGQLKSLIAYLVSAAPGIWKSISPVFNKPRHQLLRIFILFLVLGAIEADLVYKLAEIDLRNKAFKNLYLKFIHTLSDEITALEKSMGAHSQSDPLFCIQERSTCLWESATSLELELGYIGRLYSTNHSELKDANEIISSLLHDVIPRMRECSSKDFAYGIQNETLRKLRDFKNTCEKQAVK